MTERFVVLGLARPRSPWFSDLSRWATTGVVPVEFVKAVSASEVRLRLDGERPFSALVVDHLMPGVDRDLVEHAYALGCAVLVVGGPGPLPERCTQLPAEMDRAGWMGALDAVAVPVRTGQRLSSLSDEPERATGTAPLVAVCGPGGTGASTIAIAIAQQAARAGKRPVLADFALHADLAALHATPDVIPGLPELIDLHRRGRPDRTEVERLTFPTARGYRVLLGMRRHRDWAAIRPRALASGIDGLRRSFDLVVVDTDADLEGQQETGSAEVEDRNVLARTVVPAAHAVVVVGGGGVQGVHALARTTLELLDAGVDPDAIVPVLDRTPRRRGGRASATALGELVGGVRGPVVVAEHPKVERCHRDATALPSSFAAPVWAAVASVVAARRVGRTEAAGPTPIAPGSLGGFEESA